MAGNRVAVVGVGQTVHRTARKDVSMAGLVREALGLDTQPVDAAAGPVMVGGLERLAAAAAGIAAGKARKAIAHATSGPALQQNLVCVLEVS